MKKLTRVFLIAVMLLFAMPALALVFSSLLSNNIFKNGLYGVSFSLSQYISVFLNDSLILSFKNSFLLSLSVLLIQLPAALVFGFALSVFQGKWALFLKCTLALSMLLPFESIMVPIFKLSKWTHLYDKQIALILFQAFSPLSFLFVSILISSVDPEPIKAASLDTDSAFRIFLKILLPMILPGLCVLALLCFSEAWNLTEPALILLPDERLRPASIAINDISERSQSASFAASVLYSLPVILIYLPLASIILRRESVF